VLFDGIDDNLTATLSDMGSSATKWQVGFAGVTLEDGLTVPAGAYDLPTSDWGAYGVIDRGLSTAEINRLLRWAQQHHTPAKYATMKTRMDVICMNAVGVTVYDTSLDSDGGAWVASATTQSWYGETLNTATRGATRGFPALAVIVAETNRVVIYDGTDPTLPMWMIFTTNTWTMIPAFVTSVGAVNGKIVVGSNTGAGGLSELDLIGDEGVLRINTDTQYYPRIIAARNVNSFTTRSVPGSALVDRAVNDVAITALSDTLIDGVTGLPVPTIAVAPNRQITMPCMAAMAVAIRIVKTLPNKYN